MTIPLLLWVIDLARIPLPLPLLADLSYALLAAYILVSFPQVRNSNRILAAIIATIAVLLHRGQFPFSVIARGLEFAVVFGAFLAVLQFVRATVEVLPGAATSRTVFANMDARSRRVAVMIASHLLAVVLSIGAFAVIRPLLPTDPDPEERRRQGMAALRGVCIAIYWSPFTVGIGFIFFSFPNLAPWTVFATGALVALAVMAVSAAVDGGRDAIPALLTTVRAFRPILTPLAVATGAVVTLVAFTTLSNLQATIIVMPLFCLYHALRGGRERAWRVTTVALERMSRGGDDMLVFTCAVVLGSILLESKPVMDVIAHVLPPHLPAPVLIGTLCAMGLALALMGLNALLVGTVIIAVAASSAGDIPDMAMAMVVLYGWAAASMLSFASLAMLTTGTMFQVETRKLYLSGNVIFFAIFGVGLTAALSAAVLALR